MRVRVKCYFSVFKNILGLGILQSHVQRTGDSLSNDGSDQWWKK